MSELRRAVENYLATRRALGFKLERTGQLLFDFVEYCERAGVDTVTSDVALAWATRPTGAGPSWWGARMAAVRGFARWWVAFDPATELPPPDLLPVRSCRAEPYPFSDQDIAALMQAARTIPTPLKAATYETLIGLLAVTGMRVGEATGLDRGDVDWDDGLVVVRGAKFGKSRQVPLHPSAIDALRVYANVRDRQVPHPATAAWFVSTVGTRLIYNNVHRTWADLVRRAGLRTHSPRCRPRLHDLRHRFAVTTLVGWYRDGVDVEAHLPRLSTYLGHTEPADTYWYLQAVPELLGLAARRLETAEATR